MTRDSSGQERQRLLGFRAGFYPCSSSRGDALFEPRDAALCASGPVTSVPQLSLEPEFRRSHGSLYKGLVRGRLDEESCKALLVEHRPQGWPEVFAVDASTWDRCDAECSPNRGLYYSASNEGLIASSDITYLNRRRRRGLHVRHPRRGIVSGARVLGS